LRIQEIASFVGDLKCLVFSIGPCHWEARPDVARFLRALSPSRYKPLWDAAESAAKRFLDLFDLVLTTRFQIEN
jgi:hypothetical protein